MGCIRSGFLDTFALIKSWRKNEEGHNNIIECLKICKKENIHLWTSSLVIGEAITRVQEILRSIKVISSVLYDYKGDVLNSAENPDAQFFEIVPDSVGAKLAEIIRKKNAGGK